MTWLKTDDKFPEHRKVRRQPDAAYRLHHTALCACAKDETDGIVTEADVAEMEHGKRLRRQVSALVEGRLWHERGHDCKSCDQPPAGAWIIHDYLHYNPSHSSLNQKRDADRTRQERYRRGRIPEPVTEVSRRDNDVTDALSQPPVPVPSRTRPVPVPSRPDVGVLRVVVGDGEPNPIRHLGDRAKSATFGLGGEA